ncbi:signal transduction histidine kinase [Povalibacter uvarum]|uniref:histidine kinase n=1 Tax=Povalibacter uvarum TaxID=732238 RepID=A0A841HW29_9GAMM|nr:ATP-binding protein [Povalibacter uvarum]MBB6096152.1 signal transduction histidine kinase [Povalibacter uvarum]
MLARLLPDSIFGRVLVVLVVSCALAQIVATTLVIHRSGSLILRREQPMMEDAARRIADTLNRLEALPQAQRSATLRELGDRQVNIQLARMTISTGPPPPPPSFFPPFLQFGIGMPVRVRPPPSPEERADELVKRIRSLVDDRVAIRARIAPGEPTDMLIHTVSSGAADAPVFASVERVRMPAMAVQGVATGGFQAALPPPSSGAGRWSAAIMRDAEIVLTATWPGEAPVTFKVPFGGTMLRRAPLSFNAIVGVQLAAQLAVLFAGLTLGAYVAARRITRPLSRLAAAADSLGRSLSQPPVPETGPRELRQVAQGFNVMQDRLRRYIDSRTRAVAAMSHDLRTPLTRARLRLELMEDDEHRKEFERDLLEMESMVVATLDALSDLGVEEAAQELDVNGLLARLQSEFAQLGHRLRIEGSATATYRARPQTLKRCLTNLIDNAFKYGDAVRVRVDDDDVLRITIIDEGPGIPPEELERVFEPFYRLESSRSRETGGTGLGLSVARDAAQAHGGRLILRNGPDRGLEAELSLPRGLGG